MKKVILLVLLLVLARSESVTHGLTGTEDGAQVYSAYTAEKHLIMSDNGTPCTLDDDWIIDWEWR